MKRPSMPRRRSPLERGGPIKKVNVVRKAKRRKSYAQKLAAYKRSETYKLVEARAGGRCEGGYEVFSIMGGYSVARCLMTTGLQHHHRTYRRFGGRELPTDIRVLCKTHHDAVESLHSTRDRNYSR